ncbi:hypothetical protein F5B19DRAFT_465607 [Rostrohypoxylon terebratum]|nr:hypothetical protein F5B19DRAFT_465607 [Rostrohypoxylon terebratum]
MDYIPGQDRVPAKYLAELKRVREYFTNDNKPNFKFERILGTGARGFAVELQIKEESSPSRPSLQTTKLPPRKPSFDVAPRSQSPFQPSRLQLPQSLPLRPSLPQSPSLLPLPSLSIGPARNPPALLPAGKKVERFVMKRAFERRDDETIRKEIEFLRKLHGAENIQQLYSLPNETQALELHYLPGPTLFTEWIPNGQLRDLVKTRPDWNHPLPNRMLWMCFLCMCHMLIAMAWPPQGNPDAPSTKPALPPQNSQGQRPPKSTIRHNDINIGNIMFGDFDTAAHQNVPILKLIDFGQASNSGESFQYTPESAVRQNMLKMAEVMINLIGGAVSMKNDGIKVMEALVNRQVQNIRSRAKDLDGLSRGYGLDNAAINKQKTWLDNLDIDLRSLLIRCLAVDENVRPTLEELYEEVHRNVTQKTRDSYAGKRWQNNESDEAIFTISKNLIVRSDNRI